MIGWRKLIAFILTLASYTGLLFARDFDPFALGTGLVLLAGTFFATNVAEHLAKK